MIGAIFVVAIGWILIGCIIWGMKKFPDVPAVAQTILVIFGIVCSVLYLMELVGALDYIKDIPVPRIHK